MPDDSSLFPSKPLPVVTPQSRQADEILLRLAVRRTDHQQLTEFHAVAGPGRHLGQSDTRRQNALVDAVAATEVFVSERLRAVDATLSEDAVFTWAKREKAWYVRGQVTLADSGSLWTVLNGFIQIRNSIQHGMGRLTEFQLGKHRDDNLKYILATGCPLDGDLVRLRQDDVEYCFETCVEFIRWLDGAASVAQR